VSQGDGVLVGFLGNHKHHDIALQTENVPIALQGDFSRNLPEWMKTDLKEGVDEKVRTQE
jgi:hypothetical protein